MCVRVCVRVCVCVIFVFLPRVLIAWVGVADAFVLLVDDAVK